MSDEATISRLREILRQVSEEERDWDRVDGSTSVESLGIDSLSFLDLLYDVEQQFGVALEAEEVTKTNTLGEIADMLKDRGG